jgi:hypothetical protein
MMHDHTATASLHQFPMTTADLLMPSGGGAGQMSDDLEDEAAMKNVNSFRERVDRFKKRES